MKLIGREKELAIVREHVRAGRNLAVVGPAGVGKTALVREAVPGARYCADSSTVKTVCESLGFHAPDNIARKRALLRATAGGTQCFVFDHVGHVTPKLLSLLELIHESHPMIVVTRSLAWKEVGHLKMILWDFDTLELRNLPEREACRLADRETARLGIKVPAQDLWRLAHGHPGRILELCAQATKGRYVSAQLLDLDCRIAKLRPA